MHRVKQCNGISRNWLDQVTWEDLFEESAMCGAERALQTGTAEIIKAMSPDELDTFEKQKGGQCDWRTADEEEEDA